MTEITPYQEQAALEPQSLDASLTRLSLWAESATAAYRVADQLVKTSFVPDGFKGKPYEATAAILAGVEVGLSPMAALRSFDVIQGQAAPRAITLRAIVQSHGHDMELVEASDTRCRMRGRRRGAHEWTTVLWTIDRAKSLGLTGKQNWKAQPQAMLIARATSELARLIAADAILGIGYTAEEIVDGTGSVPATATTAPPEGSNGTAAPDDAPAPPDGSKRLSRARRKPTEPAPEPVDDTRPSEAQTAKIMATFGELGYGGADLRTERLSLTSALIGRTIESTNEVTRDEASRLIDQLDRLVSEELIAVAHDDGTWTVEANESAPTSEEPADD